MKREELNNIYTEWVKGYFEMRYLIDTECGCGHQGEIAKTILINPKKDKRFCVWLENEHRYEKEYVDSIVLRIGWQPIEDGFWLSELKVIHEEYYFNVSHKRKGWYVTDFNEALRCNEIYDKRFINNRPPCYYYNSNRAIKYAWNWIKTNKPKGSSKYNKKDILGITKYKYNKLYFSIKFKDCNTIRMNK